MKPLGILCLLCMFAVNVSAQEENRPTLDEANRAVQAVYDAIVAQDGTVDYGKLNSDRELQAGLGKMVAYLAEYPLDDTPGDLQKIAILANAYNVLTLVGVNRHWPVASVRKIRPFFGFFTKNDWLIGGVKLSLNDIENKYLRPLDTRIHFLVNCASGSCPKLIPTVFTPQNLESIMDQAALDFINDPTKNQFDLAKKEWRLSKIFKWYQEDWGDEKGVVAYVRSIRPDLDWEPKRVKYLDYDWSLNGPTSNRP